MKHIPIKSIMLAAFLLLCSSGAFALTLFEVAPKDVSVNMFLAKLFGGALPESVTPTEGVANPLAEMFKLFNGGILTLGSVFLAYTLIAGTMQTAHDGEMLGKQWSSMWIPIRTALGVAFVVPLQSGYCVAQLLIMWLTVQGVGLADNLWSAFANTGMVEMGAAATPTIQSPEVYGLALTALKIRVCMEALNSENAIGTLGYGTPKTSPYVEYHPFSLNPLNTTANVAQAFGVNGSDRPKYTGTQYGTALYPDFCGKVKHQVTEVVNNADDRTQNTSFFTLVRDVFTGITGSVKSRSSTMIMAHMNAWDQMYIDMGPLAKKAYEFGLTPPSPAADGAEAIRGDMYEFDRLAAQYQASVMNAMKDSLGSDQQEEERFIQNSTENGWMLAGAWFSRIAIRIQDVNNKIKSIPEAEFNEGSLNTESSDTFKKLVEAYHGLENATNDSREKQKLGITKEVAANYGAVDKEASGLEKFFDAPISYLLSGITSSFTGIDVEDLQKDDRHPLIAVQEMGERMLTIVGTIFVTLTALSIASKGTLTLIASFVGLVVFALLTSAIVMAVYTPLMPFLLFLGASVGWIILVIEAMFAAPIWAVMHLTPGGNDIMGSAKSGYSLMLGLLLRPALLILGFAAACVTSFPLGIILNAIFFDAFLLSIGSGTNSPAYSFILIAGVVVYAVVIVQMMHKVFSLIHIIPDKILRWIGGGQEQLGESAREMSQSGQRGVTAMATMSQTAATQGSRLPQDVQNMKLQKAAAENQAQGNYNDKVARMDEKMSNAGASAAMAEERAGTAAAAHAEAKGSSSAGTGFSAARAAINAAEGYQSAAQSSRNASAGASSMANDLKNNPPPGMSRDAVNQQASGLRQQASSMANRANNFDALANQSRSNAEADYNSSKPKAEASFNSAMAPGANQATIEKAIAEQKSGAEIAQKLSSTTQDPAQKAQYDNDQQEFLQRVEKLSSKL